MLILNKCSECIKYNKISTMYMFGGLTEQKTNHPHSILISNWICSNNHYGIIKINRGCNNVNCILGNRETTFVVTSPPQIVAKKLKERTTSIGPYGVKMIHDSDSE